MIYVDTLAYEGFQVFCATDQGHDGRLLRASDVKQYQASPRAGYTHATGQGLFLKLDSRVVKQISSVCKSKCTLASATDRRGNCIAGSLTVSLSSGRVSTVIAANAFAVVLLVRIPSLV
jgi:hypothetical protein